MIGAQPDRATHGLSRGGSGRASRNGDPAKPVRAGDFQADSRVFTTTEWVWTYRNIQTSLLG